MKKNMAQQMQYLMQILLKSELHGHIWNTR